MWQHNLRVLRERSGLNQFEVANRAGISQTKLSLAENDFGSELWRKKGKG